MLKVAKIVRISIFHLSVLEIKKKQNNRNCVIVEFIAL